jgi:hydroxymethylpyrimidine/phosphomethylpyrimidine kinase
LAEIALTIAGSNSGGGAGIQADLKAFSARGVYGCSVIAAVTAQNMQAVTVVHPIPTDVITAVDKAIETFDWPIIVDPVILSKSGAVLLPDEAVAALREILFPRATLLTPNITLSYGVDIVAAVTDVTLNDDPERRVREWLEALK